MLQGITGVLDWLTSAVQKLVDFVLHVISQNAELAKFFAVSGSVASGLWAYLPTSLAVIGGVALAYWVIMLVVHGGAHNSG